MDSRAFLGLEPSHNPFRWKLEVRPEVCTGGRFLFGGAGLGAAISALEGTSQRSCVWATGQYLSYAKPGEVMDIDITIAVEGHQITQARAVGHVGNREILTVNAALGERPDYPTGQFEVMPDVPPPSECKPRPYSSDTAGTINERLDVRLAKGRQYSEMDGSLGDGQTVMWARLPDVLEGMDAPALVVGLDAIPLTVAHQRTTRHEDGVAKRPIGLPVFVGLARVLCRAVRHDKGLAARCRSQSRRDSIGPSVRPARMCMWKCGTSCTPCRPAFDISR